MPHTYYLGGPEVRARFANADVVLGQWGPLESGIVVCRAPEGIEVVSAHHRHMLGFTVGPAETEAHYAEVSAAEFGRSFERRGR